MIRIFVDFDGTITLRDVGDALFETFGGGAATDAVREYLGGKISAVECFRRESAACSSVNPRSLEAFLDDQEIDPSFIPFVHFCRESGIFCMIVSDGMDYYIRRTLEKHGLDVPFYSNHLDLEQADSPPEVRFVPAFPYTDEVCDRCASCKRNHILRLSADDDIIVYIGEGYSDRCPARFADVVFAKDELLRYCQTENISYYEYASFADIERRLRSALGTGKRSPFRKRRQAELARRELYRGG